MTQSQATRRFVLPSHTSHVLPGDFSLAHRVRDSVVRLVDQRSDYIRRHGIDADFALPHGNWSSNPEGHFYQRVLRCDHEAIAKLRAFCPIFNGFHLYELSVSAGLDFPENWERYPDLVVAQNIANRNGPTLQHWRALVRDLPKWCVFAPPLRFGEIGELVNGVVVNFDTLSYQERITLLHDSGLLAHCEDTVHRTGEIRILEIGSGYGALAYWFKQAFPRCSYTLVDLPECLLFPGLYLSLSRPDVRMTWELEKNPFGFRLVPNYMAEQLREPFDLVINTLSMSEMSIAQVRRYAALIKDQWINEGGFFFEQNHDNRHLNLLNCEDILQEIFCFRTKISSRAEYPLLRGSANCWASAAIDFTRQGEVGKSATVTLDGRSEANPEAVFIERLGTINIVMYKNQFFGVPQLLGDIILQPGAENLPGILKAADLSTLRQLIRDTPRLSIPEEIVDVGSCELLLRLRHTDTGTRLPDGGYFLADTDPLGHCLYGPYEPLHPGQYAVAFAATVHKMKTRKQPLLGFEVVLHPNTIVLYGNLSADDLETRRDFIFRIPDDGSATSDTNKFEVRIGNLGNGEMTITSVVLRKLV